MRVIPVSSRLINLGAVRSFTFVKMGEQYRKVVGEVMARWDPALIDHVRTVHVGGAIHEKPMEMQGRGLIPKTILDIDYDIVADGGT